jgi:hypothetical protein
VTSGGRFEDADVVDDDVEDDVVGAGAEVVVVAAVVVAGDVGLGPVDGSSQFERRSSERNIPALALTSSF